MSHEVEFVPPPPGQGYDHQEPKAGMIGVMAVVTIIGLVAVLLAMTAYFEHVREQQVYEKVLAPVSEDLTALRARENTLLQSYTYFDKTKGQVRLPIDRAMELLVKDYKDGKVERKATPVKPPEPAGTPAPGTTGAPVPSMPNAVGKAN